MTVFAYCSITSPMSDFKLCIADALICKEFGDSSLPRDNCRRYAGKRTGKEEAGTAQEINIV